MRKPTFFLILLLLSVAGIAAGEPPGREDLQRRVEADYGKVSGLWEHHEYAEAVKILEGLAALPGLDELGNARSTILYNLGCGYSLLGETDRALDALRGAVDAGYSDAEGLRNDPDLEPVRSDPRFASLLEQAKAEQRRWDSPVFRAPYRENLSEDDKIAGLARVWAEVKYGFVHFGRVPRLDWDRVCFEALPEVRASRSTADYYRVLKKICARLEDGHTTVHVPDELFSRMYSRPAIETRRIDGRVYVVGVLDDALSEQGVRPGLEILGVDGVPVEEYARTRVAPYHSASSPQGAEAGTYTYYLLCGDAGTNVDLDLRDEAGAVSSVSLPRSFHRVQSFREPYAFRVIPGGIGYLAVNTFGNRALVAAFDSLFTAVGETDALVIDLRRNAGGDGDVAYALLGHLTDEPFKTVQGKVRRYDPFHRTRGRAQDWMKLPPMDWPPADGGWYSKPVAVLIGSRTGSAAEDFCAAFAAMKRGPLIGSATAGTTGQPLTFPLPGGGTGLVCVYHATAPDGSEFIGTGIQPTVPVRTSIEDVRAGRDPGLEAALRILRD